MDRRSRAATGLAIDPYFSATKIGWLLENVPDLRRRAEAGDIAVGTVDSWLAWKLTGGARHVTDYTNASRTLLRHRAGALGQRALRFVRHSPEVLALPQPSGSPFGVTSTAAFGAEVPILAMAGDQQAALYGQACFQPGMVKNTYGTGCFLLANAGRRSTASTNGLLVSLGPGTSTSGPEYVIEGSVFVAGAGISWLQEQLGLTSEAEIEALARSVPDRTARSSSLRSPGSVRRTGIRRRRVRSSDSPSGRHVRTSLVPRSSQSL